MALLNMQGSGGRGVGHTRKLGGPGVGHTRIWGGGIGHMRIGGGGGGVEHTRIRGVLETQGSGVGGGHARMGCVLDTQGSGGCWTQRLGSVGGWWTHKDQGWVGVGHTRIRCWRCWTHKDRGGGGGGGGRCWTHKDCVCVCWTRKALLSQVGQDWYSRVLYCGFVGHARIRGTGCWDVQGLGGGGVGHTRIRWRGGWTHKNQVEGVLDTRIRGGGGGHTKVGEGGVGQARIKVGGGVDTRIRGCWTHKVWGVFDTQGLGDVGHTRIGGCWTQGLGVAQRLQVGGGGGGWHGG